MWFSEKIVENNVKKEKTVAKEQYDKKIQEEQELQRKKNVWKRNFKYELKNVIENGGREFMLPFFDCGFHECFFNEICKEFEEKSDFLLSYTLYSHIHDRNQILYKFNINEKSKKIVIKDFY